jgi:hypothetical protein
MVAQPRRALLLLGVEPVLDMADPQAAHAALQRSGAGDAGSYLFFLDPWSDEGVIETLRLRPHIAQVRVHAESALVEIARARTQRLVPCHPG